jgi:CheY-like chemotaxis protein
MNVLILEDNIERIEFFHERLKTHTITYTDQVDIAKTELLKGTYEYLFLDHDLDDRTYVDSEEKNTGYQLCRWLAEHPELTFKNIIIHSMNSIGAQRMMELLCDREAVQLVPFHMLMTQLEG